MALFEFQAGTTKVAGKSIGLTDDQQRVGKHMLLTKDQIHARFNAENRQMVLADVLPEAPIDGPNFDQPADFYDITAIASTSVQERQRIVHDQGGYVDTFLGQLAVVLTEQHRLTETINDPRWFDHPARPAAIEERDTLGEKAADIAESIAYAEAYADRCWQTLTIDQRDSVAHMWLTQPADDRLVTRSWKDQAQYGWRWPPGAYVDGRWFIALPSRLNLDLQPLWRDGVTWLGTPVELPPDTDVIDAREVLRS